jgi:hypothetical protein
VAILIRSGARIGAILQCLPRATAEPLPSTPPAARVAAAATGCERGATPAEIMMVRPLLMCRHRPRPGRLRIGKRTCFKRIPAHKHSVRTDEPSKALKRSSLLYCFTVFRRGRDRSVQRQTTRFRRSSRIV